MITVVSPLSAFVMMIFSFFFKAPSASLSALVRLGSGCTISAFDRSYLIASKLQSISLSDLLGRLNLFLYLYSFVKAFSNLGHDIFSSVGTKDKPFLSSEASAAESTCFDKLSNPSCGVREELHFLLFGDLWGIDSMGVFETGQGRS